MRRMLGTKLALCGLFASVMLVIGIAAARAPRERVGHRLTDDSDIVARLSARRGAAGQRLSALRAKARSAPHDLAAALALARAYIDSSRASGDPRPLGHAEAVLAAFGERAPSAALWALRATVSQARHDFSLALTQLTFALRLDPTDAQAWLTQAAVLTAQGRYVEADTSCRALDSLVPSFVSAACHASALGLTGQARALLAALQRAHDSARDPAEHAWLDSLRCELHYWRGELEQADAACQRALALDESDRFTRALSADVSLARGACRRAFELVPADSSDEALILRRALAARCLGRSDADLLRQALERSFAQSRLRGDRVHQREEARLLLAFEREPKRALSLALEGFARQREPWDAQLLFEAARAAGEPAAAAPAQRWLRDNQLESAPLSALAEQVAARELARAKEVAAGGSARAQGQEAAR